MMKLNHAIFPVLALCAFPLGALAASQAYEISVIGPGGHSYGAYGQTNAVHAAARVVMEIEKALPDAVVTDIRGGVSVNAIAADATMRVMARDADEGALREAMDKGCAAENAFRGVKPGDKTRGGAPAEIRCRMSRL